MRVSACLQKEVFFQCDHRTAQQKMRRSYSRTEDKRMKKQLKLRVLVAVILFLLVWPGVACYALTLRVLYKQYEYVSCVVVHDNYLYIDVSGNFSTTFDGYANGAFGRSLYPITDDETRAMMTSALTSCLGS